MATPLYTTDILRLATETLSWPRLNAPTLTAERRAPLCGSTLILDLALDEAGYVSAVGMRPQSCAMGQASATLFARHVVGRSKGDLLTVHAAMKDWLGGKSDVAPDWPEIKMLAAARGYPARHGAIMLPFDAAVAAFEEAVSGEETVSGDAALEGKI